MFYETFLNSTIHHSCFEMNFAHHDTFLSYYTCIIFIALGNLYASYMNNNII